MMSVDAHSRSSEVDWFAELKAKAKNTEQRTEQIRLVTIKRKLARLRDNFTINYYGSSDGIRSRGRQERNEGQECTEKVKGYREGGYLVAQLCLGDMVGLSGHVPGTVVTMTAPVSAVHHPNHTAPLLGLQLIASEPG